MFDAMLRAQKPQDYCALYIDMDAFFASVSQQEQPELRGMPVAVAPCLGKNCSIVAASYEARRYGIGVGTRLSRAYELCPGLQAVRDQPALYRGYHAKIMAVLDSTYGQIGVRGIDEAYALIPSYARTKHHTYALAKVIKESIKKSAGEHITCSIGVAPNIWLAKMAAQHQKPNGLTVLKVSTLNEFYRALSLTDCTGIGRRLARRLYAQGVMSVQDLASLGLPSMRSMMGVLGEKWYLRLRGFEVDRLPAQRVRQSISHQVTVLGDRRLSRQQCWQYVMSLSTKLAQRLRRYQLLARRVGMSVYYCDGTQAQADYRHIGYIESDESMIGFGYKLLGKCYVPGKEVRLFSLWLGDLAAVEQPTLALPLAPTDSQFLALSRAIDSVNARFGPGTIDRALTWKARLTPDRIGFGNS